MGLLTDKAPCSIREKKGKSQTKTASRLHSHTAENRTARKRKRVLEKNKQRENRGKMEGRRAGYGGASRDLKWVMECGGGLKRGRVRR